MAKLVLILIALFFAASYAVPVQEQQSPISQELVDEFIGRANSLLVSSKARLVNLRDHVIVALFENRIHKLDAFIVKVHALSNEKKITTAVLSSLETELLDFEVEIQQISTDELVAMDFLNYELTVPQLTEMTEKLLQVSYAGLKQLIAVKGETNRFVYLIRNDIATAEKLFHDLKESNASGKSANKKEIKNFSSSLLELEVSLPIFLMNWHRE